MAASVPFQSFYLGIPTNFTIAASMAGTAAASYLGEFGNVAGSTVASNAYAGRLEIFNLTGRNIEVVFGNDNGTAAYVPGNSTIATTGANGQLFCPGTASTLAAGRIAGFPVAITGSTKIWVRTTENTPITCTSTAPFIMNFWA